MHYRKLNDQSPDWHFRPDCPSWPKADYVEVCAPVLEECERVCPECLTLESPFHHQMSSRYFLHGLASSVDPKTQK